jgi:hypothetical protein
MKQINSAPKPQPPAAIPDFRSLTINGMMLLNCVWTPSGPKRSARIDTIEVPGKEFEQDRFKGRKLLVFRMDFRAYDDKDSLQELNSLIDMLFPALSDTGVRTQAPLVHTLSWGPLRSQSFSMFVVSEDDGFALFDDRERCHKWGCVFRQFSQWQGPGVLDYTDENKLLGSLATPNETPTTPSAANPNGIQGMVGL